MLRVLQGLLFGVASTDPLTFLEVAALVATVAVLAGFLPASRPPGSIRYGP